MFRIIIVLTAVFYSQALYCQSYPTLDNILKLIWVDTLSTKDYRDAPIIKNGVLFHHINQDYGFEVTSGKRIPFTNEIKEYTSDSLLFFDSKNEAKIVNVFTGYDVLNVKKRNGGYIGYRSPSMISDSLVYIPVNDMKIIAYNVFTGSQVFEKELDSPIYTKPIVYKNNVVFAEKMSIQVINGVTGEDVWSFNLNGKILSNLEMDGDDIYFWVKGDGVKSLSLKYYNLNWSFNEVSTEMRSYSIIIDTARIYFNSGKVYALNKNNGDVVWETENNCGVNGTFLSIQKKFLFFYENCDNQQNILTAIDISNGVKKYQGFTSNTYPPKPGLGIHFFDMVEMRLVKEDTADYLIGVFDDKIYGFKLMK
ncbi:PQQ-binding-like beta-propeller repeat protein [Fulvivirga sp. 29W222]|uniref:PQQ-binding-like beta-propeller repeat protein n=1 Tax=Fulvivirga marina TaxID=2494733 RepID=A0A937G0J9_9BACT|nr:PQQ-binding-like beta-propeller repeat protein [Fulvivirga marina]MBL6449589.1 PQQ-binding-like beta-propeller repeat protein [Fulvivirga marina]